MMKAILLLLLVATPSFAAFVAGSYGIRQERESETSEMALRAPYGVVIGHRILDYTPTFEYLTFTQESGNQTLRVTRKQKIGLLGVRYHAFDKEDFFSWYPYFSGGVGVFQENVHTELLGMTNDQESKWKPAGSVGVGFFGEVISHIRLGADFRVLLAPDFDPQGLLDLSLRLGYQFD
jgi:hypothetical protein